jgi:hypothetical protein
MIIGDLPGPEHSRVRNTNKWGNNPDEALGLIPSCPFSCYRWLVCSMVAAALLELHEAPALGDWDSLDGELCSPSHNHYILVQTT